MIGSDHSILFEYKIEKSEMGGECRVHGGTGETYTGF